MWFSQETLYKRIQILWIQIIYQSLLSIFLWIGNDNRLLSVSCRNDIFYSHVEQLSRSSANEYRDIRARKPLVPYGVTGVKESSGYNFLRATAYISTLRSLSFVYEGVQKRILEGKKLLVAKSRLNQPVSSENVVRDLYMRCVCREGSRNGGPDGVWYKEGDSI